METYEKTGFGQTAAIILAAGESSRLGRAKQLLEVNGKNLLQHSIDCARSAACAPVIVVLGAGKAEIEKEVDFSGVITVENTNWQAGMGTSVKCGIESLKKASPGAENAILMVCDQPYVSPALLMELVSTRKNSGKSIVACRYKETLGTPALFNKDLFPELSSLPDDKGAKLLFTSQAEALASVSFEMGSIDIDTEDDYRNLTK